MSETLVWTKIREAEAFQLAQPWCLWLGYNKRWLWQYWPCGKSHSKSLLLESRRSLEAPFFERIFGGLQRSWGRYQPECPGLCKLKSKLMWNVCNVSWGCRTIFLPRGVVVTHLLKSGLKKRIYKLILFIKFQQCPGSQMVKALDSHSGDPSSIPSSAKPFYQKFLPNLSSHRDDDH